MPSNAHPHMLITDELFDLREQLMVEAMDELNCPEDLKDKWIKIDRSFRGVIVQTDPAKLSKRYNFDEFLIFENPEKKKKAS